MGGNLEFIVSDAVRESIPLLIALYGPTGSGKTFSGLLLAAGIAGPNGLVGMVDAENKRGSLYADDPVIRQAVPGGRYKRVDIGPPYTPARYVLALSAMEKAGVTTCLVDSTTHEWSGEGGCCDIAENNKLGGLPNWAKAKIEHKKFMACCLSSRMNIVFCFRAHEKAKPVKAGDLISPDGPERYERTAMITLGMLPDTEKNCVYEMLISLRIDDKTHFAHPVKVPKMLAHLFPGGKLVTKADGEAIRIWNERGVPQEEWEQTKKRARASAEEGSESYRGFYDSLSLDAKKAIRDSVHEELKKRATEMDAEIRAREEQVIPQADKPGEPAQTQSGEPQASQEGTVAPTGEQKADDPQKFTDGSDKPKTMEELRRELEIQKSKPRR